MEKIKKLFGGINLTWKKLIIFPIATAVRLLIDLSNPYFIDENGELKDCKASRGYEICASILNFANTMGAELVEIIYYPDCYSLELSFNSYSSFKLFGDSLQYQVKGNVMSTC